MSQVMSQSAVFRLRLGLVLDLGFGLGLGLALGLDLGYWCFFSLVITF